MMPPRIRLFISSVQKELRMERRAVKNFVRGDALLRRYFEVFLFEDLPAAEVKCLHFHGTEIRKPIPSYQIYKGPVFHQVDEAVDFVMSKLARAVGTRAKGPEAPVEYELPKGAVAEAIVNAVAHRDYSSNAGVQVMLFAELAKERFMNS